MPHIPLRYLFKMQIVPLIAAVLLCTETSALAQMYFLPDQQDVTSVAWSPDGTHILSSGFDGTIRLWQIDACESGPFVYIDDPRVPEGEAAFRSVRRGVMSVAWSPDGKRFVAGLRDRTVRLYQLDLASSHGRIFDEIAVFSAENMGGVRAVAYSPDGEMIAAGGHDSVVRIWEAKREGSLIAEFKGHQDIVESIAFGSDGSTILSGSRDGTIRLWDVRTKQHRQSLIATGPVYSAVFSRDNHLVAALTQPSDWNGFTLHVWRISSGEDVHTLKLKRAETHLAFSPDGIHLASGGLEANVVTVWNISSGKPESELGFPHDWQVRGIAYSPDGKYVVGGIPYGSPIVWNSATGQLVRVLGKCVRSDK